MAPSGRVMHYGDGKKRIRAFQKLMDCNREVKILLAPVFESARDVAIENRMFRSMFSADKKYENKSNTKDETSVSLLIRRTTLNIIVPSLAGEPILITDSRSSNGYAVERKRSNASEHYKAMKVINKIEACVVFVHGDADDSSSFEPNLDCRVVPAEECLVTTSNSKTYSLAKLYASILDHRHSDNGQDEKTRLLLGTSVSTSNVYRIDAELAGCVTKSLKTSRKFTRSFLSLADSLGRLQQPGQISTDEDASAVNPKVLLMSMIRGNVHLNHSWDDKISNLVVKQCILDDAMNWLSTLGGAYSALGDHDIKFADLAGRTSVEQLKIALHMASPPLIIRCRLFYCLSLIQRREFRMAKKMIRIQYRLAKSLPVEDLVLINTCHGIWNKLSYLWTLSKVEIQGRPDILKAALIG